MRYAVGDMAPATTRQDLNDYLPHDLIVMTQSPYKGRTGLDRILHAAGYSWKGLCQAYQGESAFRQEAWLTVAALPMACWLGEGWVETALLAGSVWLVLVVELLNSAIEAVVDRVGLERHDLSGQAKDMASAAVLLSLVLCTAVWCMAIWHRIVA